MVREFHNKFLHVVIDCKIGNKELDLAVEGCIARICPFGYSRFRNNANGRID